jgi:hypothetical protein
MAGLRLKLKLGPLHMGCDLPHVWPEGQHHMQLSAEAVLGQQTAPRQDRWGRTPCPEAANGRIGQKEVSRTTGAA